MKTLIVLPTRNERETIGATLRAIRAELSEAEILVADASSSDGTATAVREVAAELGAISLRSHPAGSDRGDACLDGFRWGLEHGYEALAEMDADFAHQPTVLTALLAPLDQGWDLVIGSSYVSDDMIAGWSISRRLRWRLSGHWASHRLARGLLRVMPTGLRRRLGVSGFRTRAGTAGFRAYRADLLVRIGLDSVCTCGDDGFRVELADRALRCGAEVAEIPTRLPLQAPAPRGRGAMDFA